MNGIYRVDYYARQRKLSIRFIESLCSLENVSVNLRRLAAEAAVATPTPGCCAKANHPVTTPRGQSSGFTPARWIRDKLAQRSANVSVTGLPARGQAFITSLPQIKESTVIEFLNDALVLFLIKLHWHMITQHWLRQPWRYRYEWMAAFYLIFLLVRSRRPKRS